MFSFPRDTIISSGSKTIFPGSITKILPKEFVKLLNPSMNEIAVYSLNKKEEVVERDVNENIPEIESKISNMKDQVSILRNELQLAKNTKLVASAESVQSKSDVNNKASDGNTALVVESFEVERPDGFFKKIYYFFKNLIF
jgi:succinate dehydrogenase/fumarate reductase flavoprotein subunit